MAACTSSFEAETPLALYLDSVTIYFVIFVATKLTKSTDLIIKKGKPLKNFPSLPIRLN
jgi:hypothetical protein